MVFAGGDMKGASSGLSMRPRILSILLISSLLLSGCTNPIGPPEPTSSLTVDVDQINTGESINFDARESTTPDATVIVQYSWDFGDGSTTTTSQGLTNHVYTEPGSYQVTVEVSNDQGGTDESSWTINVNAFPVVSLLALPLAKVGESITLDASGSQDPEGGVLSWAWDLNYNVDSDNDGDSRNDVDSTLSSMTIIMNESGQFEGAVSITDDRGATSSEAFLINVSTRMWQVTWEQQRVTEDWNGYLEQGESWSFSHVPGLSARLMEVNATLTLNNDILPPQDNFTLRLAVPSSGWTEESPTRQENITKSPTAFIERDGMNPIPSDSKTFEADYADDLLVFLMDDPSARFGIGNWTWQITADQSDPDVPIDELDDIDPDKGNDWLLEIEFVILIPRISEVFS
ncbi:MAG: hypothetical protein CMA77_04065 [Euryarchaeota archaeon]|nr:hypothetical protein [Euryarchaeota archaeon]